MELFTRLPDDIKILIITEFTGQFKMRNGQFMAQLNLKFLDLWFVMPMMRGA